MKRTLTSLAAMAAAGAASAQTSVTLFGKVDAYPVVELTPMRIGPLLNDPDPEALDAVRRGVIAEMKRMQEAARLEGMTHVAEPTVYAVSGYQAGKTAALASRGSKDFSTQGGWQPFWTFPSSA